MFGTLIESQPTRRQRTGSSVASIIFHSAIITAGVMATAREVVTAPPPPPTPLMHFIVPERAPIPATERPVSSASIMSAPSFPALTAPITIPVGIPPIDFSIPATTTEFRAGPIGTGGIFCERDCAITPASDGNGNQLWSSSDVMMRLLQDPIPPRYPESLRRAGVEGDVVAKFEVDTTGRVDPRSVEILRSTHDAFTAAVRESLAKLRFAPAATGERKVRALAVMPFHFTLK